MADDYSPGLEGVIAFETEIAEPDKDGGALRYRGVDIEDLVGPRHVRQRLGAAGRRQVRPRPAAGRAVPDPGAHRRRPRRRAGRAGDALAGLGLPPAARHQRRGGPRAAGPRGGHGAVLRGPVGPWPVEPGRPADPHRPVRDDHRAVHDPLARRARPGAHQGRRRLLRLRRRARHERLDVHRPGDRLHRRRRRRRDVRRHRRDERPAARRRAGARAADDRGGRADRRRRQGRRRHPRPARAADGLRAPRLPRRGPARPRAASHLQGARRAAVRGGPRARAGRAGRAARAAPGSRRSRPTSSSGPRSSSTSPRCRRT